MQLHYTPQYVLDDMELYEIIPIIQHLYLGVKDSWEQARLCAWAAISPHQKNRTTIDKFIQFAWERPEVSETPATAEDIEVMKEKIKYIEDSLNG